MMKGRTHLRDRFGQAQDNERTRRAGFDAHLTKPADAKALTEILSRHA